MPKKVIIPLEDLSREELVKKCYNQRELIKQLQDAGKFLLEKITFLESFDRLSNINRKTQLCYEETMSLFDDIEQLKNENAKLKKMQEGE